MRGGMIVMDWEQVVRHLSVSSNESQANRLTDGVHSTYWQSSGPQGKVSGEIRSYSLCFINPIHVLHPRLCVHLRSGTVLCVGFFCDSMPFLPGIPSLLSRLRM